MIKLLRSEFIRLFKSKIFYLGNAFMFGFALFLLIARWYDMKLVPDYTAIPDELLMTGASCIGIVIAVFIGSFIGSDYKNGTIRNKLTVGHNRISIYFSNLIVCAAASLIMHMVWIVVILIFGPVFIGKFVMSPSNIILLIFVSFFAVLVFTCVFLLTCMLISSKSVSSVTAIILSVVFLMLASAIFYKIEQPEYIDSAKSVVMDDDGNITGVDMVREKNPQYLRGAKRKFYELLNNALPNNQIMQLGDNEMAKDEKIPSNIRYFPLYSLALIVVTTASGVLVFRKKDLK